MDYMYENLGDERFQEFCSALLLKEYRNLQAFPVGQPDGGRDSVVYYMNDKGKDHIVFQVKYSRNGSSVEDPYGWLQKTIEKELIKIRNLVDRGAKEYVLMTNIKGSGHLDSGTIDKVNAYLKANIEIPSICLWRDDLSRRFEADPIFRWSFPEILNGQDVLNSTLFNGLQERKEFRESVIRAYLTEQYSIDNEVKFKQIDLQNRLLSLFTDVPIRLRKYNQRNRAIKHTVEKLSMNARIVYGDDLFHREEIPQIGAAAFLLHSQVQDNFNRILLEGGPGQGKSTICQYVCQVHRSRILGKAEDAAAIPKQLRKTQIRIPFKIDLRDVATWVEKKNPYAGSIPDERFSNLWKSSLEAFIQVHIAYHSKLEVEWIDLLQIFKLTPLLFVFDGFDEIANLSLRAEVIEFINKGIARLAANSKSIQVIVTSRPAAFTDSISFPVDNYPHFVLGDLTPAIMEEYVEKWIMASKIEARAATDLKRLIKDKLDLPHLKDLTKSPMQLAIFINLLRTKGQSLPNKRTALYDSYISLFFDREAEKNDLILEKRDLIIDIHQYLGWVLHSEAELYKTNGIVDFNNLIVKLKKYLEQEGHNSDIADRLFNVMKERVCALVSRVQGTFEFEVQPLREYFCARYLYNTAPHSPVGTPVLGTKPDRFRAILKNYYWQNVVRFFAGCVDAGELDMVIAELKDLQADPMLKYTHYPRVITAQILSDYVFAQKPLKLKQAMATIVDGINIGDVLNQDGRYSSSPPIALPKDCGRTEVNDECFRQLQKFPKRDLALELIGIIKTNPVNNLETWLALHTKFKGELLTKWFEYCYQLQLVHQLPEDVLEEIIREADPINRNIRLQSMVSGNRIDILNKNVSLKEIALSAVLNLDLRVPDRGTKQSLSFLTFILSPAILVEMFRAADRYGFSFGEFLVSYHHSPRSEANVASIDFELHDHIDRKIHAFGTDIREILARDIEEFVNKIDLWNELIETGRKHFGECWAFKVLATVAAGIRSKEATYEEQDDLTDTKVLLAIRVRSARMKSGNVPYWQNLLVNPEELPFKLLVLFTWGTPKTLIGLSKEIHKGLESLSDQQFALLRSGFSKTSESSKFTALGQAQIEREIGCFKGNRFKYLLSLRMNNSGDFLYCHINNLNRASRIVVDELLIYLTNIFLHGNPSPRILAKIKKLYKGTGTSAERQLRMYVSPDTISIPYGIAKKIMIDCKNYPRVIASIAEQTCRSHANKTTVEVGKTAINEDWFTS